MSTLTILLLVLLIFAIFGGFYGRERYGAWGWSPVAIVVLVAVVLYLTGHLRIG